MKASTGLAVVITGFLVGLAAIDVHTTQAPGQDEQDIRKVEADLTQAELRHDAALLDAILDDDYATVDILGRVTTKVQVMAAVKAAPSSDLRMDSMENDEIRVRVYGNTGVVTGRTTARGSVANQDFNNQVRFTRVYVKRGDRWRLVASHVTRIGSQ